MRTAELPETAEDMYQSAVRAGTVAADMRLEERSLRANGGTSTFDVDDLVRTVVDAVLAHAGLKLRYLALFHDQPYHPGSDLHLAYVQALVDASYVMGSDPAHKAAQLKLRLAGTN